MMNFDRMIERRGTYCTQWDYVFDRFGKEDLLPFTISDTDFALPDVIIDKLEKRLTHGVFGYTRWNHWDFKHKVASWFAIQFGSYVKEEWVVYSPSVIYSVSQLINQFSEVGNGVIIQTPAYDAFFKTIIGNQRKVVENPLIYHDGYYSIDFDHLEQLVQEQNNRILLLCSPHNPTGRVWKKCELEKIVQLCKQNNIFIISDEIHMDIVREDFKHISILDITSENVALLSSGTKTFNFPSLLFSYLIVPNEQYREIYLKRLKNKDGLSSPSVLGMLATMTAYEECYEWVQQLNCYLDDNIEYVITYIETHCPKLKVLKPEATYLVWIDIANLPVNMHVFQESLVNNGHVAIMDGSVYVGNGEHFLRLNVGCSREKLQDGLERLLIAYDEVIKKR